MTGVSPSYFYFMSFLNSILLQERERENHLLLSSHVLLLSVLFEIRISCDSMLLLYFILPPVPPDLTLTGSKVCAMDVDVMRYISHFVNLESDAERCGEREKSIKRGKETERELLVRDQKRDCLKWDGGRKGSSFLLFSLHLLHFID